MIHNKRHWDYKSFMMSQANKSVKSLCTAPSCMLYQNQEIFKTP